uniref:probable carboxylesterase 18 n=1 Tax=Erigeron canadensis TaxID=72917 RepID=UPI001CB8A3FB|nr:probable carboxylesterase 18 [Erigeron canadensis]
MEIVAKTPNNSLSLPWRTRIHLRVLAFAIDLACRANGTVNRILMNLFQTKIPPTLKPIDGLKTYDVVVNPNLNIWFRVYIPIEHAIEDLPLIVFFHGGGFAFLAPNVKLYDETCRNFARKLPAIIISVDYRLAPEHPYPAQYDDGIDVLKFLDDEENRSICLLQNANFSRCFVAGDSAGGNIAHHVAQRACQTKFKQLKVIGLLAIHPFFGGEKRTNSEKQLDGRVPMLTTKRTDWFWDAYLTRGEGCNRDHPSINVSGPQAVDIAKLSDFPETLVVVSGFDILHDWQKKYYEWLIHSGKQAQLVEYPNMFHDFFWFPELPETNQFYLDVIDFVYNVFNKV